MVLATPAVWERRSFAVSARGTNRSLRFFWTFGAQAIALKRSNQVRAVAKREADEKECGKHHHDR
jgi:hypothetical protein